MRAQIDRPRNLAGVGPVAGEYTAADGVRVLVLLPDLDTLLGARGFAAASASDPIILSEQGLDGDGWQLLRRLFGARPARH